MGEARIQATLFPELLDDYITKENPTRVIDVFVDKLDLNKLEFKTIFIAEATILPFETQGNRFTQGRTYAPLWSVLLLYPVL